MKKTATTKTGVVKQTLSGGWLWPRAASALAGYRVLRCVVQKTKCGGKDHLKSILC